MKTRLIETDSYYLLVDEEAKCIDKLIGQYNFDITDNILFKREYDCKLHEQTNNVPVNESNYLVVIAHLPKFDEIIKLEGVDLMVGLPNDENDVELLAVKWFNQSYPNNGGEELFRMRALKSFKDGYMARQSEREYSLEDLANYLAYIEDNFHYHSDTWHYRDTDEPVKRSSMLFRYIKSLNPGPIDFAVEMEERWGRNGGSMFGKGEMLPKIIDGVLQGKWIFRNYFV